MRAEIVGVGNELLLGFVDNTNASYLSRALAALGIETRGHTSVGDDLEEAAEVIRNALRRADIVLTTGGLGPTDDDLTREAAAEAVGRPLAEDEGLAEELQNRMRSRNRPFSWRVARQANLIRGARPLHNAHGTAPGQYLFIDDEKRLLALLPGPAYELIPMVETHLLPVLSAFRRGPLFRTRTLKFFGIGEPALEETLLSMDGLHHLVSWAPYGKEAELHVCLRAGGGSEVEIQEKLGQAIEMISSRLGKVLFSVGDGNMEGAVADLLVQRRLTVGVAESCTGGLLAHRLTNVPGSSAYFRGGVTCYSGESKIEVVGVKPAILEEPGVLSAECAAVLAEGARRIFRADLGVGITGLAGPGGGTPEIPSGTVFFAVDGPHGPVVERGYFPAARQVTKERTAQAALDLLRRYLLKSPV